MAGGVDWAGRQAPSLADFERLAETAWKRLPREFRDMCGDVVIRVEDFPTEDVVQTMRLESAFDLLGLYQGVSLNNKSVLDPGGMPSMVFLYRRPMLDYWAEHYETLGTLVTHVLVHEIGHHFGLSDADMEHIEAAAGG
ncbi:MAG: metallopeptidase family protein [Hyphomonadaceae bacterium]|jgi:predicted Zn-dependent protease with MMP-like domain|nr:metallopeptidase family protein [Hyphomonadaceae bacterium]